MGFDVLPTQTNFIFARPPKFPAEAWLQKWREKRVLVRWFKYPATKDYVRITIGTGPEMETVVAALAEFMAAR